MQFVDLSFPLVKPPVEQADLPQIASFKADQLRAEFCQELLACDEVLAEVCEFAPAAEEFEALRC